MRRRLRERKRQREARLLDLGALVYELHRQGKRAPELLQEKAAELSIVDQEVRELEAALDGREVVDLNERERGPEADAEPADAEETAEADALEVDAEHDAGQEIEIEHEHDPEPAQPEAAEAEAAQPDDEPAAVDEEPRP
jgi:hypothetical protein